MRDSLGRPPLMTIIPHRLIQKARSGDPDAQCRLAERLMASEDPTGYRRAIPWLRRGASHGIAWAAYHIGLLYDHGLGVRRNRGMAARWYERAAKDGYDSAQVNLGIILANRPAGMRDLARAMRLYRKAAAQGNRNAAYNLGLYYERGRGVRRSFSLAKRWYRIAAKAGDRGARRALAKLGWSA